MRHDALTEDPDLKQAIEDLLPVSAELKAAKRALRTLDASVSLKARREAELAVSELRGRIALRAERIGVGYDPLMVILWKEAELRERQRRRPARRFMIQALQQEAAGRAERLDTAKRELEAARQEYQQAERDHHAASAAQRAYAGVA